MISMSLPIQPMAANPGQWSCKKTQDETVVSFSQ